MADKIQMFIFVVVLGLLLFFLRGFGPELPSPGEELRFQCLSDKSCNINMECVEGYCENKYPVDAICNGKTVTKYGAPSFHLDSNMTHMVGLGCSNDNQCKVWNPDAAIEAGVKTVCCINEGWCYG